MKVMETVNVVIDESLYSSSKKGIEEFPKEILPLKPKEVQEIVEQEPVSLSTPVLWKILQIYPLYQILNLLKRKDFPPGLN